ncbi:MAG: hypothetical protein IJ812_04530, partial [Schwartzia sp.]|nr:hypothetical protein [Schwartzia sp. (in: firmicutes)]
MNNASALFFIHSTPYLMKSFAGNALRTRSEEAGNLRGFSRFGNAASLPLPEKRGGLPPVLSDNSYLP